MMSERDVETLGRVVTAQMRGNRWTDTTPLAIARAVLASDWLAADRARVRAETLAEVEGRLMDEAATWGVNTRAYAAVRVSARIARDMAAEAQSETEQLPDARRNERQEAGER